MSDLMQTGTDYRKRRRTIDRWLVDTLGDNYCGTKAPPGQQVKLKRPLSGVFVADYHEDGGTLWIGYSHEWLVHMGIGDSLRLARFILWDFWARATWFGLKRRIWFWALTRDLDRTVPHRMKRR